MNKSETTLVKERVSFRKVFDDLTVRQKREIKKEIAESIGISIAQFYRRMRGENASNDLEKDGIERVFAKYGKEDIWD